MHGQALMAGTLAGCATRWEGARVFPVDAKFSDSLSELQSFSAGKMFRLLRYLALVGWTCLRRRIDTVILTPGFYRNTFLKDSLFIWLCAFLLRRRVVAWFHMDYSEFSSSHAAGWFSRFFRTTLLRCRHFVVCAESLRGTAPGFLPEAAVAVVPNGIPDPAAGITAKPGSRERLRVLYVSNMNEEKGWKVLLQAARMLCAQRPDVEFVFHGAPSGGFTEDGIHAAFAEDSAGGRIRYAGFLDAATKAEAFRSSDIFCMPSFTEAFPIAVIEAMAFGLPVVATRVGGIPDMLGSELSGGLVPARDGEAICRALRHFLDNRMALVEKGNIARRRYEAQFTESAFSSRWEAFMRTVSGSQSSPAAA